jgi:hypothetical protein
LLKSSFACLRLDGKNIASDFDLVLGDPRCIIKPKRAKCLSSSIMACSSCCLVWKRKKLSST